MNTVTASLNTTARQMTKMFQRKKAQFVRSRRLILAAT